MADKVKLDEAEQLYDNGKYEELVTLLKTLDQSDIEVQWRLTRGLFECSKLDSLKAKKDDLIKEAYDVIEHAIEKGDNHYAVHQWYAILLDAHAKLEGTKARVKVLDKIEKHMKRAVELNPQDPTGHYILGEFAFQIADLSWIERKIVNSMLSNPPQCTYEEALEHFLKAEEIKAGFYSMNFVMIGKCYIAMKNNGKAKEYLTKACAVNVVTEDDRKCVDEGTKLMSKVK